MLKTKQRRVFLVAIVIFSLLSVYAYIPLAQAASLTNAKDTISDSDVSVTGVTHTIQFTTGQTLSANYYMQVILPSSFGNIATSSITCPDAASTTPYVFGGGSQNWDIRCVASTTIATGTKTLTIANTTNPGSAGDYTINLATKNASDTELESAQVKVYIIDDVTVTATVDASLTFTISGVNANTTINGVTTTGTSTATTIAFGTLNTSASSTLGQALAVSTNATDGFVVTVQQDQELTSAAGANINSFDNSPDGTGSTTPHAWAAPAGTLDLTHTYGHMGITTDDSDLATDFTGSKYAGLNSTNPLTIMSHNGPADGLTQNKGYAKVAYTIEITDLQEAGDYTNTLTYICTPTY